jgi:crossover junction endodeoxyribonuclease RuvC
LHERALYLVKEYQPDVMALEAPFYGKNVQSMLKLGRGQGVIMAAALLHGIPIFEYAPLLVKQAITGMGRASKEQVAYFLQKVYWRVPPRDVSHELAIFDNDMHTLLHENRHVLHSVKYKMKPRTYV